MSGGQPVEARGSNPLDLVLSVLNDDVASRLRKALSLYVVGATSVGLSRQWWRNLTGELNFTVSVDGRDDIYPDLQAWVLERVPAARQRSLSAQSHRSDQLMAVSPGDSPVEVAPPLRLSYDGRRSQTVHVAGHRVRVTVESEDITGGARNAESWSYRRDRIVFTARGVAARDAVVGVLARMAAERNAHREVRFYSPRWGEWQRNRDTPLRSLDTVILAAGLAEEVSADLGEFLSRESDYANLGIPWHRGYLFTGPPGVGKTSLAKGLAVKHSLDIYFLPIASVTTDAMFLQLLGALPARAMLLIEDVDIVHGAKVRDDGEPGVSLSGLLNGLDGVATPHGLVTVLTSNDDSVLDEALVRPGRVDVKRKLGYLDVDQLERLLTFALGQSTAADYHDWSGNLTPADVIGVLKANMGDVGAAALGVAELVWGRRVGAGR